MQFNQQKKGSEISGRDMLGSLDLKLNWTQLKTGENAGSSSLGQVELPTYMKALMKTSGNFLCKTNFSI
jgi:hypothetical protein